MHGRTHTALSPASTASTPLTATTAAPLRCLERPTILQLDQVSFPARPHPVRKQPRDCGFILPPEPSVDQGRLAGIQHKADLVRNCALGAGCRRRSCRAAPDATQAPCRSVAERDSGHRCLIVLQHSRIRAKRCFTLGVSRHAQGCQGGEEKRARSPLTPLNTNFTQPAPFI